LTQTVIDPVIYVIGRQTLGQPNPQIDFLFFKLIHLQLLCQGKKDNIKRNTKQIRHIPNQLKNKKR
jgi:hypothetical protein